tara:strand:- start:458 stop:772 length:315 start_codon:yes stop_codon:yes gene_type:complete
MGPEHKRAPLALSSCISKTRPLLFDEPVLRELWPCPLFSGNHPANFSVSWSLPCRTAFRFSAYRFADLFVEDPVELFLDIFLSDMVHFLKILAAEPPFHSFLVH